jgi:DNA-binding MarR family transcriptional regulator
MARTTRWLDDDEQRTWRGWLALNARLPAALNRQLQRDSDLSLQDFDVLVRLTDQGRERLRVSELAAELAWERSRLSHHLTRMAARGLVVREECEDDGRGAFVVLTPEGRRAIEAAAPEHVDAVRRLVFAELTPREAAALGRITRKLLGALEAEPER